MHYPFNEIQKFYTTVKDVSVVTFADQLCQAFPWLIPDTCCQVIPNKDNAKVIPHDDIWMHEDVLQIVIHNLAVLALTDAPSAKDAIISGPLKWANDNGDKDDMAFIRHLAKWALTANTHTNGIIDLVYLAYYDADIRQQRKLESGNIILPGDKECTLISQLADTLTQAVGRQFDHFYRLLDSVEYNDKVSNGHIDFVIGDTLYLSTLGPLAQRDRHALLVAYCLATQSTGCTAVGIRRVCMVSLSHGTRLVIDIPSLDPMVLSVVNGCLYGPTVQGTVETVLPRKRRVTLIMGLTALLDAHHQENVIQEVKRIGMTYLATQADITLYTGAHYSYQALVDYFTRTPDKGNEETIIAGIQLLNQWLVDLEMGDKSETVTVRLSDELTQDIVRKAHNL